MKTSKTCLWAATGLILVGCNHDREALDRFSKSYTSFLDTEVEASVASYVPMIRSEDNPKNPFWNYLSAALEQTSSNTARAQSASACIATYNSVVSPYLDKISEQTGNVDKRVLELIETSNAIQNREYRSDALDVAKSARQTQINLANISKVLAERFAAQRKVMERLVANSGNLVATILADRQAATNISSMAKQIEEERKSLADAERKCRDSFSALKGKSGLKHYASKYDQ